MMDSFFLQLRRQCFLDTLLIESLLIWLDDLAETKKVLFRQVI
jgi:hypothetical protein